jgi:hypothetical protein
MNQTPNGITQQSAQGGLQVVNLGALANAGTTQLVRGLPGAGEAALGDIITATRVAGGTHTIVMPQMPVGSEVEFQIATAPTGTVTFQELDEGGVARIIEFQSDAGGNVALTSATLFFPVTDYTTLTAAVLDVVGATTCTVTLRLRKNLPSSTIILSDGWTIENLGCLNIT